MLKSVIFCYKYFFYKKIISFNFILFLSIVIVNDWEVLVLSAGHYPKNSPVKFRGDSGLLDGSSSTTLPDLEGGFFDSGNNIKFSFTTAYTVTLLSYTVIEYHEKYADIGELEHVKDIIKWGSDYLVKIFPPQIATSDTIILYSQASIHT